MSQRHSESNRGPAESSQKRALSESAQKATAQEPVRGKPAPQVLLFGPPSPACPGDAPPNGGTQGTIGEQAQPRTAVAGESKEYKELHQPETVGADSDTDSQVDASESDDGSDESTAELLRAALTTFDQNSENVPISDGERARVMALLSDDKNDILPLQHQLRVTVKPSVQYQTGQLPQGKLAKQNRADPTKPWFGKDLEKLLLQAACHDPAAPYEFWQAGKMRIIKGVPTSGTFFIKFSLRKYISRIISAKLTKFKGDFDLSFVIISADTIQKPFDGAQPYHCKFIRDLTKGPKESIPKEEYVRSLVRGKMDTEGFKGIRKGQTLKADGTGNKYHDHYEIYFDPTMTANHGIQELDPSRVINLMDDYACCIPVPKFHILEPPSYLAYKDSTGYIHKRELIKSGDWCPYCWGKTHEKGYKCVYYNFCKRCLAFNPREKKFKDLALHKHLCNYGINEMPRQRVENMTEDTLPEQNMTEERKARLEAQQAQVDELARAAEADRVSFTVSCDITFDVWCRQRSSRRDVFGSRQPPRRRKQGTTRCRRSSRVEKCINRLINKDYNVLIHYRNGTEHLGLVVLIIKSRGCLIINYVNTEFNYFLYVFYHKDYG